MNGAQARAARAMLQLKTTEVAALAGVSPNTVTKVEQETVVVRGPNAASVQAIRRVYEERGVSFLREGETAAGIGLTLKA